MIENATQRGEPGIDRERGLLLHDWQANVEAYNRQPTAERRETLRTLARAIAAHNDRAARAGRAGVPVVIPTEFATKEDRRERKARKKARKAARAAAVTRPDGTPRDPEDAARRLALVNAEFDL